MCLRGKRVSGSAYTCYRDALVEEESLSAICLTPKVKRETKRQNSQNTLQLSKFQVQLKVHFSL